MLVDGDRLVRSTSRALCQVSLPDRWRRPTPGLDPLAVGSDCGRRPGARTPTAG